MARLTVTLPPLSAYGDTHLVFHEKAVVKNIAEAICTFFWPNPSSGFHSHSVRGCLARCWLGSGLVLLSGFRIQG